MKRRRKKDAPRIGRPAGNASQAIRCLRLLRLLRGAGSTANDLAAQLAVTPRTIRRDLTAITAAGYELRDHGHVVSIRGEA